MSDSATGGIIQPSGTPPLEGAALEDFFNGYFKDLTGLDENLIRPRWQPEPPNLPPKGTVWMAFGFSDVESDTFPYLKHIPTGDGSDQLQRHEEFDVLCSIYGNGAGSDARATAKLLRDNLAIPQNLERLRGEQMAMVSCGAPLPVPALVKQTWLYRLDMTIRFRRAITRTYAVLNIETADIDLQAERSDDGLEERTITVEP